MSKFFQNRSNERHRKMFAQSLANEEWDSLRSLIERKPKLVQRTHNGWSLLHSLVYHPGTPNSLIRMVASLHSENHPEMMMTLTPRTRSPSRNRYYFNSPSLMAETPLHLCCDRVRPDLDRIRILLQYSSAESLLQLDTFGRTSFFLACANDVPLDILQSFIRINSVVATVRDIFAEHPLECLTCRLHGQQDATKRHDIMEKVTYLAMEAWRFKTSYPRYDDIMDNTKENYLLLAVLHVKPSLVSIIARVYPNTKCLWMKDGNGDLPIHAALRNPRAPRRILDELIQLAPDTAKVPSGSGQLPLHLAVGRCSLELLVQAYPAALSQVVPQNGLLPYLDAASRDVPVNVIYTLLRNKPDLIHGF